ncbi:MAG: glycosyltransferase, partial [Candidatus Omnitrophica bacterium]|nr:glycosyltransferase [Candidatus Omnitrophota bacterium]
MSIGTAGTAACSWPASIRTPTRRTTPRCFPHLRTVYPPLTELAFRGGALLGGSLAALDPLVDTVVFLDGDHSDDPEDLPALLAPIAQGRADFVIGSRVAQAEPGSLTLQQRFGNRLACALMRRLFGARYTDLGPFRAIRREALEQLRMRDQDFGWTVEMQAKAALHRLRIVEVPVRYRRRIGRSKISGTLSGTVRA